MNNKQEISSCGNTNPKNKQNCIQQCKDGDKK